MSAPAAADDEQFLTEDPDIPGQKFCLLSFLSPERILAKKETFFFDKFLSTFEYTLRVSTLEKFLMTTARDINARLNDYADKLLEKDLSGAADVVLESRVRVDTLMDTFQAYVKDTQKELKESRLKELYQDFLDANREKLEDEFYAKNDFHTTVRGLKIRGTYGSKEEAVARSKKLQRADPIHNIYVAEVGKWLPWDPEPTQVKEQEYAEEKLNTLMKKYRENEEAREAYEREARDAKLKTAKRRTVDETEGDAGEGDFNGIFNSGPADLAIQRKMEAAAAQAAGAPTKDKPE
jgi:Family of unknown function (DUF5832)